MALSKLAVNRRDANVFVSHKGVEPSYNRAVLVGGELMGWRYLLNGAAVCIYMVPDLCPTSPWRTVFIIRLY